MRPKQPDALPLPGQRPERLYADEHLLVVNKPQGWLTHPDGQGLRPDVVTALEEPVGVHQRLDVDTTGVLAFSRSPQGAALLDQVFAEGQGHKTYLAVVDGEPPDEGLLDAWVAKSPAKTRFQVLRRFNGGALVEAVPYTGRTHQIRVHLSQAGWPIRGDARYGDPLDRRAPRALLHCARLSLPDGRTFEAPLPPEFSRFAGGSPDDTRAGLASDAATTAYRVRHGAADGCPGVDVDRYGDWLYVLRDEGAPSPILPAARGIYELIRHSDRSHGGQPPPRHLSGAPAPESLLVEEHGVRFRARLGTELSSGLFLDQRPQRAWLAQNASGLRVLNTFAHAGGFSVAAAVAGAETVSVDLSKAWLARIPEQLADNGISPEKHDCIFGDVFDWLKRLAKRGERFDLVILDPPSTSVGVQKKRWSAGKDYPELVRLACPLVAPGGRLWTVTNYRKLTHATFAWQVASALPEGSLLERSAPPAVDFPTDEPFGVKTLTWRLP